MRVLTIPEMLDNPYVKRKEEEPLSVPRSVRDLPERDRNEIEEVYTFSNSFIDLKQTCEEMFCNILMSRQSTGRDIVLSGRIVEKIVKMNDDRTIDLEELEWTFLKERFFPEDHGKKEEEKVFQGFGLTAKMYPLLDAIENAPKKKEEEEPSIKHVEPGNKQPEKEEVKV